MGFSQVSLFVVVFIGLIGLAMSIPSGPAWTASTFANKRVRGFNSPGDISDTSMSALNATGANLVRHFIYLTPATYKNVSDSTSFTSFTYDQAAVTSIVNSANKYMFKVMFVLCMPDNSPTTQSILWANNTQGTKLQNNITAIWTNLATLYKGNAAVAGFDLYNEPIIGLKYSIAEQNQWIKIATRFIKVIRKIDPNRTIVFEPTPGGLSISFGTTFLTPLPYSNIVYSFHDYNPYPITFQGIDGYTNSIVYPTPANSPIGLVNATNLASKKNLQYVINFQKSYNVSILVGEFSSIVWAPLSPSNSKPTSTNLVKDTVDLYEQQGWAWNYHAWREYYGWDSEIPSSYFYQFNYTNAFPNVFHYNYAAYRNDSAPTITLLKTYFKKNYVTTAMGVTNTATMNANNEIVDTIITTVETSNPTSSVANNETSMYLYLFVSLWLVVMFFTQ